MKNSRKLRVYWMLVVVAAVSCKKETTSPSAADVIISPTIGTRMQLTLDSLFLYAKQIYLWNDALPAYGAFDPRNKYGSLSPEINAYQTELLDISQLKLNPATDKPFELPITPGYPKYSYLKNGNGVSGSAAAVYGPEQDIILNSALINSLAGKVAYVALASFPELNTCKTQLDNVFSAFAAAGAVHMVFDLRSNGGGYVETAEYVADLVASSSLNNKVMFSEQFNAQMQGSKATILKNQPYLDDSNKPVIYKGRNGTMADVDYSESGNTYKFNKKGSLETVKDIYFIVSGHTASASELLISCLKPYFNVKLVGEKTYGKPVGFFAINIDQYGIFLSSFLIRNSQGRSDYFDGMQPDLPMKMPESPVLGDPAEPCLNKVLEIINGSAMANNSAKPAGPIMQVRPRSLSVSSIDSAKFTPMIEHRLKLKR